MTSILQDVRNQMLSPPIASPKARQIHSPLSSPLSFRTAPVAHNSPASVAPIDFGAKKEKESCSESEKEPKYRDAKILPFELRHQCMVYFEEQIYTSALTLWNNIVSSGTSYPSQPSSAFAPPASHLAFASTLMVHPTLTTRARAVERPEVPPEALTLLKNVLAILGPVNGNLSKAFTFSSAQSTNLRHCKRSNGIGGRGSERTAESDDEEFQINRPLAHESSLWQRGQDFWHVVGWAFNCSVKYPKRWEYWRVWLEYMLDFLDADWKERTRMDNEAYQKKQNRFPHPLAVTTSVQDSLLMSYLAGHGSPSSRLRRVVRSIFADGSAESIRAYPEVFERETKNQDTTAGMKRKRDKVDIDEDKYGDYDEEDDVYDVEPEDPTPNPSQADFFFNCNCGLSGIVDDGKAQISCEKCNVWQHIKCAGVKKKDAESDIFSFVCETCKNLDVQIEGTWTATESTDLVMGGPEAVALRQRLLALLSRASSVPDAFASTSDLFIIISESIMPLPLTAFSLFVSPTTHIPDLALSSLVQVLLARLLPNSAPTSSAEDDGLSQDTLKRCFLPFAANTSSVADNAKVSVLVETLFRLFIASCPIVPTKTLTAAVQQGIEARLAKIVDRRKKKGRPSSKEDAADKFWLKCSGKRLRYLSQFAEKQATSTLVPA